MCVKIHARKQNNMVVLSLSFFITAILYASIGFGGGSTYNALLVLAEVDYQLLPVIALLCNLIVVSGGAWRFARGGYIKLKRILPLIVTSIPAAWIGGNIEISEGSFILILGLALLFSGLKMLWPDKGNNISVNFTFIAPVIGGALGFLAGLVGIGGGIFLAPILHLLRFDNAKAIAGTCSVFILLNSLSGLVGQITKLGDVNLLSQISLYWLLFPAVFIGGQIGSYMGAVQLKPNVIKQMTAILILYVALRLLWRIFA